MGHLSFFLEAAPPFRRDVTVWTIGRRPEDFVDQWDGETYQRVLAIRGKPVLMSITQLGSADPPRLNITASAPYLPIVARSVITAALERLLGLRMNLGSFYQLAASHRRLRELAGRFRGLKPPRFPTVWEGLVNGIACQQFSLAVGILLLNRVAALCGLRSGNDSALHAFSSPEDSSAAAPKSLRSLGSNGAKTRELIGLAVEITLGRLDLERIENFDNREPTSQLFGSAGCGAMDRRIRPAARHGPNRCFFRRRYRSPEQSGAMAAPSKPLDCSRVMRVVDKWRPYGGLIYFHFAAGRIRAGRAFATGAASGTAGRAQIAGSTQAWAVQVFGRF